MILRWRESRSNSENGALAILQEKGCLVQIAFKKNDDYENLSIRLDSEQGCYDSNQKCIMTVVVMRSRFPAVSCVLHSLVNRAVLIIG